MKHLGKIQLPDERGLLFVIKNFGKPIQSVILLFGAQFPRGMEAMILGGKVRALLDGRFNVSVEDVQQVAHPALRHRMILNFEGEAEEVKPDHLIEEIIGKTTVEAE